MSANAPHAIADDVTPIAGLLRQWLGRAATPEAMAWLDGEVARQRDGTDERRLGLALGLVGRRIGGRAELSLSAADLAAAKAVRSRWRPDLWSAAEAARVALLLATWRGDEEDFAARIDRLCVTGELTEHVACLKGFAIFPAPERLLGRAREAVRSSVQPLFDAMACHNPYPAERFDQDAFNHMVVKCVFSDVPLVSVIGLDERRNDDLVRMLRDLVSERHAAGRTLPDAVHRWIAGA